MRGRTGARAPGILVDGFPAGASAHTFWRVLSAVACAVIVAGPAFSASAQEKNACLSGSAVKERWLGADRVERLKTLSREGPGEELDAWGAWLLAEAETRFGPDSLQAGFALDTRVSGLLAMGRGPEPETRRLAESAAAIGEQWLEPTDQELADILFTLGRVAIESGDSQLAKATLERVLAIYEEVYGPDSMNAAATRSNLAMVLNDLDDNDAARKQFERALAAMQAVNPDHPNVLRTMKALAWVLTRLGDYGAARMMYERALSLSERIDGKESWGYGATLNGLGRFLLEVGDYAAAESALEGSLAIIEKQIGPDSPKTMPMLYNLSWVYKNTDNYPKARACLERGLRVAASSQEPDGSYAHTFQSLLGLVLARTGEFEQARRLLEGALATEEKKHGQDSTAYNSTLDYLAELNARSGDYDAAIRQAERVVAAFERIFGGLHRLVGQHSIHLAEIRYLAGDLDGALADALHGEEIAREIFRLAAESLSEREALTFAAERTEGLDLALTIAAERRDADSARRAWDAVVQARALVLDELGQRRRSLAVASDPDLAAYWTALDAARQRVATLVVAGPSGQPLDAFDGALAEARLAREAAERELASRSRLFRDELDRGSLKLQDAAGALPVGGALVAYVAYSKGASIGGGKLVPSYLAFIADGSGVAPVAIPLGASDEIDGLVAEVREQVAREAAGPGRAPKLSESSYREAARALRQKIWDPVASRLKRAKTVLIVPDGSLGLVPFAALPSEGDGYLVERGPLLHVLDTERDLAMPPPDRPGRGLLAVGAPAYDGTALYASATPAGRPIFRGARTACGSFSAVRFDPLPFSATEVRSLGTIWRDVAGSDDGSVLTGEQAAETAVKREAGGRRVVHLATHAFFVSSACNSENPLVLSGLAFAGANHRDAAVPEEDDGVLTAEEIASLDLGGTEWAVLSGCDTGLGEAQTLEGLLGLRRAFQVAGARTVISSLWPVEDETTRSWMTSLYTHRFKDGLGTAEAVRAASLDVLKERRKKGLGGHPFHWAAFVAVGDWR